MVEDSEWVNIYRTYSKQRRMFDYLNRNDMMKSVLEALTLLDGLTTWKRPRAGDAIMTNQK